VSFPAKVNLQGLLEDGLATATWAWCTNSGFNAEFGNGTASPAGGVALLMATLALATLI
jgi:hypothetical protein